MATKRSFQCHHGVPASGIRPGDRRRHFSFQCHHGVPASGHPSGDPGEFPEFQCHHGVPAFSGSKPRKRARRCFNATTAFLLGPHRVHPGGSGDGFNATTAFLLCSAMPPAGSGSTSFNATTAFLLTRRLGSAKERSGVSMPPRRSCFSFPAPRAVAHRGFQCHHGVPAFVKPAGWKAELRGFNATTAFLLGASRFWEAEHDQVSMPPRRSCFQPPKEFVADVLAVSMPPRRSCFMLSTTLNLHEALVSMPPRRSCFVWDIILAARQDGVSMPPRRSCFRRQRGRVWRASVVSMPPRRSCF